MSCEKHRELTHTGQCIFCLQEENKNLERAVTQNARATRTMEKEVEKLRKQVQFYSTSHIGELSIEQLAEFAQDLEEDMKRMKVMLTEVEEMIQIKQEEVPRESDPCP
jgi:predicted RNase H-like nuclease (RuvC/YqgF family)